MKIPGFSCFYALILLFLLSGCTSFPVMREEVEKSVVSPPAKPRADTPAAEPVPVLKDTGITYPLHPVDKKQVSFIGDDLDAESLVLAVSRSLEYYDRLPPGRQYRIGDTLYSVRELKESLLLFLNICLNTASDEERDAGIRENFDIYRPAGNGEGGQVVFTGYYEPVLRGSPTKTERFRYPIYRVPDDAVVVYLGKFSSKYKGERLVGRVEKGELVPYPTREEIDGKGYLEGKGLEIVWVDDPVELFFLHIQGSGRIVLPDGKEMRVNYAQSNGRAFRGASSCLLEKGRINSSQTSHQNVKKYLQEHPEELDDILYRNDSYVFFRTVDVGPVGALEVPLTGGRTVAADPAVFPKGGLVFINARKPVLDEAGNARSWEPFSRFVLFQDTGGMIKGPGRIDLFCGSGDGAERIAGSIKEKGSLYFLVKKKNP